MTELNDRVLFVNGTLMRGQPLHQNLSGAEFLGDVRTAPKYRLYSIRGEHPGMFETQESGIAVRGELYGLSDELLNRVEAGEPPGLYRGKVELEDGRIVDGILYPRHLAEGTNTDISAFADWPAYLKTLDHDD
jgi:gamma-glutamylcyclotransferase (GGCT)/AIG2-like uncharacterized protein YtfP